jgi:hypothetical protein
LSGDDYSLLTTWTVDHCTPIYHYSEIPVDTLFVPIRWCHQPPSLLVSSSSICETAPTLICFATLRSQ